MTAKKFSILPKARTMCLACLSVLLVVGSWDLAHAGGFLRTETRAACDNYDPLRQPFFGDLHVHTSYSHDAYVYDTRNDPRAAYRFAKGDPVTVPNGRGVQNRQAQIDRPLDFVAVTDHAEYFADVNICMTPGAPGHGSPLCQALRGDTPPYPPPGAPSPGPPTAPPWFSPRQMAQFQNNSSFNAGKRRGPPSAISPMRNTRGSRGLVRAL